MLWQASGREDVHRPPKVRSGPEAASTSCVLNQRRYVFVLYTNERNLVSLDEYSVYQTASHGMFQEHLYSISIE